MSTAPSLALRPSSCAGLSSTCAGWVGCGFFEQVPKHASTIIDERGMTAEMDEPDDEAVRAAVSAFRQIYTETEPTSAAGLLNLLHRSVRQRGSSERQEALAAISVLKGWMSDTVSAGIGFGIVFDHGHKQHAVDPREILDAYFHGHYLHSGNEKSELVRRLDDLQPWARYTLYNVMWALTRVYWVIANNVELILNTPTLLDADATSVSGAGN